MQARSSTSSSMGSPLQSRPSPSGLKHTSRRSMDADFGMKDEDGAYLREVRSEHVEGSCLVILKQLS